MIQLELISLRVGVNFSQGYIEIALGMIKHQSCTENLGIVILETMISSLRNRGQI